MRVRLLTLHLVRFGLRPSESTEPGRMNAYWHFAGPSRVVFSSVTFHAEVEKIARRPAGQGMTDYQISIVGQTGYIEVIAEDLVSAQW
jgi:hypothetical protein